MSNKKNKSEGNKLFKNKYFVVAALTLIFSYIIIFPFGQLTKLEISIYGKIINLQGIDIIVIFTIPFLLILKRPKISKLILEFFIYCIFSLLISYNTYSKELIFLGSLYLFRLFAYFSFFNLVWNVFTHFPYYKNFFFKAIIASIFLSAVFGWYQYISFTDLTYLKFAEWDDHWGRLVGTFLDPTFTGIILTSGFFLSMTKFIYSNKKVYLFLSILFSLTVLYTYSRASYLSFLLGLVLIPLIIRRKQTIKYSLLILLAFIAFMPFLPRTQGEGVRLERTKSILLRIENYKENIMLIKKYPLFGVGYNNICWARIEEFSDSIDSHSCYGSDSSILFVFVTTGVVGFILFSRIVVYAFYSKYKSEYENFYKIFLILVLVHSLFSNSFFYSWVLGLNALFYAAAAKE